MSLEIDDPIFFQLTFNGLVSRTAKVLFRLAPFLLALGLVLAAFHWLLPFSRQPSELLNGWGLSDISYHGLAMLVPLYLTFIPIYGCAMATLRGEPVPSANELTRQAIQKLPICLFMVILEMTSPSNIWIVLAVCAFAWLIRDKLVWDEEDPEEEFEKMGRRGVVILFAGSLFLAKSILEYLASGHPASEGLAYGLAWAVLFAAGTVSYHDHRILTSQVENCEEEIQRALAAAREARLS